MPSNTTLLSLLKTFPSKGSSCVEIFEERIAATVSPDCLLAFDGRKNAFSVFDMPEQTMDLDVPKDDGLIPPPDRNVVIKTEVMKIVVRQVARINFHDILMFTSGVAPETESVMHASVALAVLIRHVPSMLFTPVGANFFTPEGRKPIGGGLEIWRGYHQSIRSMMVGHLGINIDVASTVFRKGEISVMTMPWRSWVSLISSSFCVCPVWLTA
ncbi:hypothetical protein BASA61_001975 [Batrachochytrium salamandrivorans]|nr:hypothetical protein BASA61_001975 [Batrachochytrium salamandrivorans]